MQRLAGTKPVPGHDEAQAMILGDLELFSTQELIHELLSRSTFQGVIVHADGAIRDHDWEGERTFVVSHNASLATEEVGRLLDVVSQHIALRD